MYEKTTKWLKFEEQAPDNKRRKTKIISVRNHDGHRLGEIRWKSGWRQYCYIIDEASLARDTIITLSNGCINSILTVIEELTQLQKGRLLIQKSMEKKQNEVKNQNS